MRKEEDSRRYKGRKWEAGRMRREEESGMWGG